MEITLAQPDDFHMHLRDGDVLSDTLMHASSQFGRVIVMPNLKPPVRTVSDALLYKQRIQNALPKDSKMELLMTLYLTDTTTVQHIREAKSSGVIYGCKLYPAGATTNSEYGVTLKSASSSKTSTLGSPYTSTGEPIWAIHDVLMCMAEVGLPLLVHGEVTDNEVDVFDKEALFIEIILKPLISAIPSLKIVMEHVTTSQAVEFVTSASSNIVATITAHHLLYNRNDLFKGGIRPHLYCLPILKREVHRKALLSAAISGNPKFFIGTDSAPHAVHTKESTCGCAGVYTGHAAIELYAEAFASVNALDKLEGFTSRFGQSFYQLPVHTSTITLREESWEVPMTYAFGASVVQPLRAGETIKWKKKV